MESSLVQYWHLTRLLVTCSQKSHVMFKSVINLSSTQIDSWDVLFGHYLQQTFGSHNICVLG